MKKILIKSINNFNTALGENITLNIIEDDFKIKLTIKNKNKILFECPFSVIKY